MIHYTLKKKNSKVDILSKTNYHIRITKILNYNMLKINNVRLLLANKYKLVIKIYTIKDNQKEFLIEKKRFDIFKDQINKIIK